MTDTTYFASAGLAPARHLQRAGQWDTALTLLPEGPQAQLLRAEILVDRHMWRLDAPDDALAALDALRDAHPDAAAFLTAQLEYWRRLLRPGAPQIADDPVAAFAALAPDERFAGWSGFWHAVSLELLAHDTAASAVGYRRALAESTARGDRLLESYAVRHLGSQAWDAGEHARAIALFERSLDLRAARGARPHTAAAQAALADVLGESDRAASLRSIVASTADELGLAWLRQAGDEAGRES
jgi:hypothetical protein